MQIAYSSNIDQKYKITNENKPGLSSVSHKRQENKHVPCQGVESICPVIFNAPTILL